MSSKSLPFFGFELDFLHFRSFFDDREPWPGDLGIPFLSALAFFARLGHKGGLVKSTKKPLGRLFGLGRGPPFRLLAFLPCLAQGVLLPFFGDVLHLVRSGEEQPKTQQDDQQPVVKVPYI